MYHRDPAGRQSAAREELPPSLRDDAARLGAAASSNTGDDAVAEVGLPTAKVWEPVHGGFAGGLQPRRNLQLHHVLATKNWGDDSAPAAPGGSPRRCPGSARAQLVLARVQPLRVATRRRSRTAGFGEHVLTRRAEWRLWGPGFTASLGGRRSLPRRRGDAAAAGSPISHPAS